MGALVSEAVRYYQLRMGEVIEGINGLMERVTMQMGKP